MPDPNEPNEPNPPEDLPVSNTPLFAAIRKVSARYFDGAPVVPRLTSGYDENQMFRPLGSRAMDFHLI